MMSLPTRVQPHRVAKRRCVESQNQTARSSVVLANAVTPANLATAAAYTAVAHPAAPVHPARPGYPAAPAYSAIKSVSLKPPYFNGFKNDSECIQTFLAEFLNVAQANEWSEAVQLRVLPGCLKGRAASFWENLKNQGKILGKNFAEISNRYIDR